MRNLGWTVLFAGLVACNTKHEGRTFDVEGTVKNAAGKMIYLEEDVPAGQPVIMDSVTVKNDGSFRLQAPVKEESLYQLRLKDKTAPLAFMINDGNKAVVEADAANAEEHAYTVKESSASQALINFDKDVKEKATGLLAQEKLIDSLRQAKAADTLINTEYRKMEDAVNTANNEALDFFKKSNSPVLTIYAISSYLNSMNNIGLKGLTRAEVVDVVNAAAAKFPNHTGVQTIKKSFAPTKAPDFTQPDVGGRPISLSSFRGKYVLLDFWASWCGPCRKDNPNVVKAYNEFKDKNFTVFGVSLDQNKDAWQKAIQQDGLAWTQVSDLKFWNNDAAVLYGVQAIPANFLIDPQGNIIAQDLHGEEIEATLRRIIK